MSRPLAPVAPMEAHEGCLPAGRGWLYEPKWDGFRCLATRSAHVRLRSKAGRPLERYFPEVAAALGAVDVDGFALDGELVVPTEDGASFDRLLQRIHPAASRVRALAAADPALLVVFDLLAERGRPLAALPLSERRRRLEAFFRAHLARRPRFRLSPATPSLAKAERWLASAGRALDGVVAKPLAESYRPGDRTAWVKVKRRRTADCVVGGYRTGAAGEVASLLLGLYGDDGRLHHVGFVSGLAREDRVALAARLAPLRRPPGFTGRAPGGPSRWSHTERAWTPLAPRLVVEVEYDHAAEERFRHGTRFLRWRPDKPPRRCLLAQLASECPAAPALSPRRTASTSPGEPLARRRRRGRRGA